MIYIGKYDILNIKSSSFIFHTSEFWFVYLNRNIIILSLVPTQLKKKIFLHLYVNDEKIYTYFFLVLFYMLRMNVIKCVFDAFFFVRSMIHLYTYFFVFLYLRLACNSGIVRTNIIYLMISKCNIPWRNIINLENETSFYLRRRINQWEIHFYSL